MAWIHTHLCWFHISPCVALSGQQTLVELHASRTNEDVRMYTCRIYSSRDLDTLLYMDELELELN